MRIEVLDDLARSLAKPMPRRQAVRVLGVALVSAAVPGSLRPSAASAGRRGSAECPPKPTCPRESDPKLTKFCGVVNIGNDKCVKYRYRCCGEADSCCDAGCCPPCNECMGEGEDAKCRPKTGVQACTAYDPGSKKSEVKCCPPSECCFDNGPFGKGQLKVACCPRERCCGGECCGPKQTCVNGKCKCDDPKKKRCGKDCCKKGQPCCDGKICCRKEGGTCCGIDCCDPKTEQNCCKQGTGSRCCPKGLTCCGKECCDPKESVCTRSPVPECCDKAQVMGDKCCPRGTIPMKTVCCPPERAIGKTRCCPEGTVVRGLNTNPTCCPRDNPDCCGDLGCLPPTICINGTCRRL